MPLRRRVEALRPALVFGHTHFGWDATIDGVRYVQPCLAYPQERAKRLGTVFCGAAFLHGTPAAPLCVYDVAAGFPPRYDAGWSNFYSRFPRQP